MLLNLFLVVVFERLLVPSPLAKRNLAELLDVLIAMLLFVLPLLLPEDDTSDVCTKLECVFFKEEEEKEVLATAAAEQPFLSTIKLLAVRMMMIISSLPFRCFRAAC